MREIKIQLDDDEYEVIRVKATPLALLYYRQAFNADLVGDFVKVQDTIKDFSKIDSIAILQIIWAMAKAGGCANTFPSFETWLELNENISIYDKEVLSAVMEEAVSGFFRRSITKQQGNKATRASRP